MFDAGRSLMGKLAHQIAHTESVGTCVSHDLSARLHSHRVVGGTRPFKEKHVLETSMHLTLYFCCLY